MKNIYKSISLFCACSLIPVAAWAQCGVQQAGGTATNMFTLIRNNTSSIATNKDLNTITFIHRADVALFGGNSGHLKYDISTDGGATWTINQATMNPVSMNYARYPNIAIYNPVANTNTANAYVSYMAPTINTMTSAWNGEVTGVCNLSTFLSTETYSQNGIGTTWQAGSLVNGAPGVFWAIDPIVPVGLTGFNIYKGVWNGGISDIVWNINYVCTPPFNISLSSPVITDYNIAFDPTGQIGYFSFLGHVTPGPSEYGLYPVLYKTTNGGASWTGPIQVDLTKFSCITSNTTSPNVPSANIEHDLVVDVNGDPHVITTLGGATNYNFSYTTWHHMYDITIKNGLWVAYDLGNVMGSPYTFGITPNFATQWQAPQAARTADGTKIFFTWTDNTGYTLGAVNSTPDLFGKAFNVTNNTWTQTKDFSSCNLALAGKIFFPHISPEVLQPTGTTYKIPIVYGETSVPGDLGLTANFKFLNNITFSANEFSITIPPANITIQQAPLALICPGSSITLNVNAGQAIWNTGATTTSLSVTTGTAISYSVTAQSGCNVGTATIAVANLTLNASGPSASICPGTTASFSVAGNALGYTWTPGSATGTNVTLTPFVTTVTLSAMGSSSCIATQTLNVNILPTPTVSVAGNNTICAGSVFTQTASGAQSYLWSDGTSNATFTDVPLSTTVYTVVGTAANSCTNMQTVNVFVNPTPTILASSNPTSVCNGQSVVINALGAVSYSVNSVTTGSTTTVTPNATTIYTVTGAGANLCESSQTLNVIVNPLPVLVTVSNPTAICKGQTASLSVSGAASYTWSSLAFTSTTAVSPTLTTVYTVTGTSTSLCKSTETVNVIVNALPTVSASTTRSTICKGETTTLTAGGATNYTWTSLNLQNPINIQTATAQVSPTLNTTYSVSGTDVNGCPDSKTVAIVVSPCSGISEEAGRVLQLAIYPNPNAGSFRLKGETTIKLNLVNELGQVIKGIDLDKSNTYEVSIENLSSGIYFLVGQKDEMYIKQKVIVTK